MFGLAGVLLLGIGAQWLAWRLKTPSILLLLLFGFAAGPFTGQRFIDPDGMLGESLLPFVSLAVAIILFEGGLTLRFHLLEARLAVNNLILLGMPLTFGMATVAARWILDIDWQLAALMGAILVVTGPTVIVPLLRTVRPSGAVGSVVRWEAIVTDPFGAILAVIVFQAILTGWGDPGDLALELGKSILVSGALGALMAGLLVLMLHKHLVPDFLHSPVALALALGSFVASNQVMHESGLLAVTVMGIVVANQKLVAIEHIVEFKENLRVLLISTLFILLAARLPIEEFTRFDWRSLFFVVALILVVRPLMVLLSTIGSGLSWKEKIFVAWMAPRGIVAAAVASVFAIALGEAGVAGAERIVPVIFLVIIVTVLVYGFTATPLARRLGLSKGNPQGILLIGAHFWARKIAAALEGIGLDVLLVDTNHHEVQEARIEGLTAYFGSALSEDFEQNAPLDGVGYVLGITHNDEVNALACLRFAPIVGRGHTFQMVPEGNFSADELPRHLRGHVLFGHDEHFWDLEARFREGSVVKTTRLSEEFGWEDFQATYDTKKTAVLPLFLHSPEKGLRVSTADRPLEPVAGDTILAIVEEPAEAATESV